MNDRSARNTAMDLLARRDHSRAQLEGKLRQRGFDGPDIETALDRLQQEQLLDERRFAESYLHQRSQKGFGPLRIRHELSEHGVPAELIADLMAGADQSWEESMRQQRIRKFGAQLPDDYQERMKQARFLQNRGFSPESVMRLFRR